MVFGGPVSAFDEDIHETVYRTKMKKLINWALALSLRRQVELQGQHLSVDVVYAIHRTPPSLPSVSTVNTINMSAMSLSKLKLISP